MIAKPISHPVFEGANVTLICTGTLQANVTGVTVSASWTGPDEQPITTSNTLNVSQMVLTGNNEFQSTVVIAPSSVKDSGLYTCSENASIENVTKQFMANESIIVKIEGKKHY